MSDVHSSNETTTFIYGLMSPLDGRIHYVGKSDDPPRRLKDHLGSGKADYNDDKRRWIADLKSRGLHPEVVVLQQTAVSGWREAERKWIRRLHESGHPLTNVREKPVVPNVDAVDREKIEREPRVYPPVHPGEMLREEWLVPLEMNANQLAKALGVNRQSVYEIANERRGLSAEMALRLARWSGMTPRFWMGLQERYDLETAEMESGERIGREVEPLAR